MARPKEQDGTGLVIICGTSSWGGTGVDIFDFSWGDLNKAEIDITNYASAARQNMPAKLYDPGTFSMKANWNTDFPPPFYSATASELVTIVNPPCGTNTGATGTATNTPGGEAVQAWVKKIGKAYPIGNRMEGTFEFRATGAITNYAAS